MPNNILYDTNTLTNCTVDDLRNINDEYEPVQLGKWQLSVSFMFTDCNLTTLPDGFFANVPNAKAIEFINSSISTIGPFAFRGLTKLETLTITFNPNLMQLETWTPYNMDKLIELNLHHNGIHDLVTFALRRYPKLVRLDLRNNFISEIPVGFFDFSLNIESLNLATNSLQRIESSTFKALLRLIELNLAHNQIDYIDSYAFTTTTRLKTMRLNDNRLTTINSMIFYNLARLEYLNLSDNAIKDYGLEEDAFLNTKLIHLDVSHNAMISIQTYALSGLKALKVMFQRACSPSFTHVFTISIEFPVKIINKKKNLNFCFICLQGFEHQSQSHHVHTIDRIE